MQKGFILLNCDLGAEEYIVDELEQLGEVKNAYLTFGAYDVIAEIQSENQDDFEKTIAKIRKLSRVISTMTLNVISD
ncbi:MAG: Lrp/AsnC family transcriptional regulator [Nitrosopumilus sp. B06]|nr:MAG: Lrp/AsnC family transcriptional regulator [Nitrosopumilus sp. B06]